MTFRVSNIVRSLGAFAAASLVAGCGSSNSVAVKGVVTSVEHICEFEPQRRSSVNETYEGPCSSGPGWAEIRKNYKNRGSDLKGRAVVKVYYMSPADQTPQTGELVYDGFDDEFYALDVSDEIELLVDKTDPAKFSPV